MRTWLLTLAALPFALLCLLLIKAIFDPTDLNLTVAGHRAVHLHADAQSVELITSRQISRGQEPSEDYDRDWAVLPVRRSTMEVPFGMALYTMWVITIPHMFLLPLCAVLPTLALLQLRRARLRRLNPNEAPAAAPAPMDERSA